MAAFLTYPMARKKLPRLDTLLRDRPSRVVGPQSPDAQRAFFYEFARRLGLRIEHHATPVLEYPVK